MIILLLKRIALLTLIVFSCVSQASGDIILDPGPGVPNLLSSQIKFHQEIGQTFTAENAQIATIGFFITDGNAAIVPNDFTVQIDLFEGVGSSGTHLGTRIFSGLSNGFEDWADVDYSTVIFVVGQTYTALISNDTVRWFVQLNNHLYDGGDAIYSGSILNGEDSPATDANAGLKGASGEGVDLEFRVLDNSITESISVDIKPQSCPNPLNVKSKGVLPVSILGLDNFDVTEVDIASLRLEGVAPHRSALEDVATPFVGVIDDALDCTDEGPDGFDDLTLKFRTQDVVTALGAVSDGDVLVLQLTGNLLDGTPIAGEDVVVILKKGKRSAPPLAAPLVTVP